MKKQPQIHAFDEIINKKMTVSQTLDQINFKIDGVLNGAYLYNTFPFKCMAQIQVVNRDGILGFDLLIIALEPVFKTIGEEWVSNEENYVQRLKLSPYHFLGYHILPKIEDIQSVRLQMKQSPKQQHKLAVLTSIKQKGFEVRKDKIYSFSINPSNLKPNQMKPNQMKPNQIKITSLNCSEDYVRDFCWFPNNQQYLIVLLQNQYLEVWNPIQEYNDKFIKCQKVFDLRENIKVSEKRKIHFTNISFMDLSCNMPVENKTINLHRYSLFLSTKNGEIYSLYPFLPQGTQITNNELQQIFKKENSWKQLENLQQALNQSGLQLNQETENYYITNSLNQKLKLHNWRPINSQQNTSITTTGLQIYPLNVESSLIVQTFNKNSDNGDLLKLSLMSNTFAENDEGQLQNIYFPVRTIIIENLQHQRRNCRLIQLNSKINASEYLEKQKGIYFTHNNGVYKLDIEAIYKFLETNKLSFLENQNSLSTLLILRVPNEQMIEALQIELQDKVINFVRRSKKKLKYEIQTIQSLNTFSQIDHISRRSRQILLKLQSLCADDKPLKEKEGKKELQTQLDASKQRAKKLGVGIEEFKKYYKDSAQSIKNRIDRSMADLKTKYESMKKKQSGFNKLQEKGAQLKKLYQQIQKNNKEISSLFQNDIGKRRKSDLEKNVDDFSNVIKLNNNYKIDSQVEKQLVLKIDQLGKQMEEIKKVLNQIKDNSNDIKRRR